MTRDVDLDSNRDGLNPGAEPSTTPGKPSPGGRPLSRGEGTSPPEPGPPRVTRSEQRAGLFVLVGLLVLGFFYFFGEDVLDLFKSHRHLVAWYDNVGGLEVPATVKFAGRAVGKVTDIRIVDAPDHKLEVDLKVLAAVPLREGTTASIRATELVIGKYVELSGGNPGAPLLKDGAVIPGTQEPLLDDVVNSAGGIILNIRDIAEQMNRIFRDQNLENLVANLDRMAEMAAGEDNNILNNLRSALNTLVQGGVVENLVAITEALNRNKDKILSLVDQGNRLATDSGRLLDENREEVSALIADLTRLVRAFSQHAESLSADLATVTKNGLAMSQDLPRLIHNTDSLLTKLDRSIDSLNKILARTENIGEADVRRFFQHEGIRIYFSEKKAPPLPEAAPEGTGEKAGTAPAESPQ